MIVEITNLTDGPGKEPREIDIFGRTISPGDVIKVPATLVDKKTRTLEENGQISIGQIPSWYAAFKSRRRGKVLTQEELEAQLKTKPKPEVLPSQPPSTKPAKSKKG